MRGLKDRRFENPIIIFYEDDVNVLKNVSSRVHINVKTVSFRNLSGNSTALFEVTGATAFTSVLKSFRGLFRSSNKPAGTWCFSLAGRHAACSKTKR